MSYFLCLAIPAHLATRLPASFDSRIHMTDASSYPIGKTTRGKHLLWSSFLLQVGSSSASLIGKGSAKKSHNNDHSELLVSGIQKIFDETDCHSLSLLAHWMEGYITTEQIALADEQEILIADLPRALLSLAENIRYTIIG